jgi:hypothetical protein
MLHTKFGFQLSRSQLKLKYLFRDKEKLINFTEDEEQQYEEQSDPEETFVKP